MDKELNSLLESILLLLIQMLKGFIMGVWHGLRKALQNKWYLIGIGITGVQCDLYHRKSYGLQNDPGNYPGMAAAGNLSDAVGSAGDLSVSDRADGTKKL